MRNKHLGWIFLITILLHIGLVLAMSFTAFGEKLPLAGNFILSEAVIVVPALLFLLLTGRNDKRSLLDRLGFHKIKISSAGMLVLYAFLLIPLATLCNAVSMLFVENRVVSLSSGILELGLPAMLFFTAVNAPFCEELVFRGVIYRTCRERSGAWKALWLSAILFGLMHMNFNQAGYAMVLGLGLALALEATDSLWGAMIIHVVFNASSSLELFLISRMAPQVYETMQDAELSGMELQMSIGIYLMLACITTALAGCVLAWISQNERRQTQMCAVWNNRKQPGEKILTFPLVVGVVLALSYMIIEVVLQ